MLIAAFPKCWIDEITTGEMDLFSWIELSAQLECDGLEFYYRFLKSHKTSYLRRIRQRIQSLGMSMPMLCCSPDFTIPDPHERRSQVEQQREMIKVTAELGGTFCRALSGQAHPAVTQEQGVRWTVEGVEACLPCAEEYGVVMVMENHFKDGYWEHREFAQKAEVFLEIVDRIESPYFGVQYDPSNAIVAGDDPIELLDVVLPKLRTMHASDRYLSPGTTLEDLRQADGTLGYPQSLVHGVTGKGMNDYDAIFSRIARVSGERELWISIEDGMNGMQEMKESVDFLKTMREKYSGGIGGLA